MPTTLLCAILAGVTGFIAGMVVELMANSMTIHNAREESTSLRRENRILKQRLAENIEIIEINDNTIKEEDLFQPW